eukprot:COSAG02_NODE_638_length_19141_cov_20.963449_6_plen_220_part_00
MKHTYSNTAEQYCTFPLTELCVLRTFGGVDFSLIFICAQYVPEFLWDRLRASIQFPVMPKRAQYARFSGECLWYMCTHVVRFNVGERRGSMVPDLIPFIHRIVERGPAFAGPPLSNRRALSMESAYEFEFEYANIQIFKCGLASSGFQTQSALCVLALVCAVRAVFLTPESCVHPHSLFRRLRCSLGPNLLPSVQLPRERTARCSPWPRHPCATPARPV